VFAFLLSALKTQSLQQTICLVSLIAQIFLAFLVVRPSIAQLPLVTMSALGPPKHVSGLSSEGP